MSATAHSSAEAASLTSAGLAGVGAAAGTPASSNVRPPDGTMPVVGQRWRDTYEITEALPASNDVRLWRGRCVEKNTDVVLRAFRPAEPEIRLHAWAKLGGIDSPHLQRAREAVRAGEWRIEVADAPVGVSLNTWRSQRTTIDPDTVKAIVSQLADALAALHAFELVHLGIRPESIFVVENGPSLTCVLAGLDALTCFDRKESLPAAVDPFYAPPEAVGLNVHVPGPGICGWDWWSLGRVVQEIVLGRHIVAELAPVGANEDALRRLAEQLLMEADPKGPRAGAVERMPGLDPTLRLLLRGLLTTTQDGRWTNDNVDRWIRGLPVRDHYDTPRKETHFRWRGRPYTIPEIAAALQSAEHWSENNVQLFEQTTPGTLAHFLRWSPTQSNALEQLSSALELAEALPLKLSTPAAQREAVIMVALLQLSGGKLVWRSRPFEAQTIPTMMDELGEPDALLVLRGLTMRSTALQIERVDPAAGRLLTELGRTVSDVESILKRYGWLNPNDTAAVARIFRLALEPVPALRAARESLAQKFAGSDHTAMEKMFKSQNVGRAELVVLAWSASAPEKLKFYDHVEATRRRAEALHTRGTEVIGALTWVQLERALLVGRLVLGGWGAFILTWFLVGTAAILVLPGPRGLACVVVPAIVALLFRMVAATRTKRELRAVVPDAPWTWRDGPTRCQRELRVAGRGVRREVLETELSNIEKELSTIAQSQPATQPLPGLPRFGGVRMAGTASWSLLLLFGVVAGWQIYRHPVSAKEFKAAWNPVDDKKASAAKPSVAALAAKANDSGTEIKVSWPYKAGDRADKLSVRNTQEATSAQIEYATKHGRELAAPYRPESISMPIVLPVPAGDDAAVMIFDGRHGELVNRQVYILEYRPLPRNSVDLDGHKGVYLDQ